MCRRGRLHGGREEVHGECGRGRLYGSRKGKRRMRVLRLRLHGSCMGASGRIQEGGIRVRETGGTHAHRVCRRWGADTRAPALARGPKASRSNGVCIQRPRLSPTTAKRGEERASVFVRAKGSPMIRRWRLYVYSQALASKGRGWLALATSRAPLEPLHGTVALMRLLRSIAISRRVQITTRMLDCRGRMEGSWNTTGVPYFGDLGTTESQILFDH